MQRRNFLKLLGIGAGAASAAGLARAVRADDTTHHAAPARQTGAAHDWEAMNAHHKEGVQTFLDGIGTDPLFFGNVMPFTVIDGVKVFEIRCQESPWDIGGGNIVNALTYNGTVPGPMIRVTEGDRVRAVVINETTQPTAIHWHGLFVPFEMDGVPFITQAAPIMPGETFVYEFTVRNAGSHMYHSHYNAVEQVTKGMLGAFIVDPLDTSREPVVTGDYTIILNDAGFGFTLNGKSFPYTQPIVAKLGDRIRVRYMNEGLMIHPMHLHGLPQLVIAKDGWNLPTPYMCDTVNVAPGERYDVVVECTELGAWAYHCHILNHAEGMDGMFGMVTALVITE